MTTFPAYKPLFGTSKTSQPAVRRVQFGDGYQQRLVFGLNQDPKEWTLEFNLSEAEAIEVETFLEARAGAEAFDWTPPDSNTSYKWICAEWTKSLDQPFRAVIRTKFIQVFEP